MSPGEDNHDPGDPSALAALASLAFGRGRDAEPAATGATRHLAFLATKALELDLLDPGQRDFGDYELLELLGTGGTGVVYRARQKSLDREVAIKLLSAGPWASPDFIERFQREAQSAARLQHPNIVAIHEIGIRDELNYFSMALVHGPNLAQLLAERGRFPPKEAARLVRKIAEALDYAHRLGVLHLDLKPGNVVIDDNGEPQVADFGLARRIDDPFAFDSDEISGTPSYMAPEQIEMHRHQLGVHTDIYGLGAILYELLSGHPPFAAASPKETLALVLAGQLRRPSRYRDDIPADLEAICLKCIGRQPQDRYASAQLLADDLGRFLDDRPVSVRPLNRWQRVLRWSHREPLLALTVTLASVAVLIGLVSSIWQWQRAESSASIARQHLWAQRHETAWRLFEEGRNYQALPLLASNLREQEAVGDDDAAAMERVRLQATQGQMPALLAAIDVGARVHVLALSADGRLVALGLDPNKVALYEVATGRQLWRITLDVYEKQDPDTQLRRLLFTPDMRWLLVTEHPAGPHIRPSGHLTYRLAVADGSQTRVPAALQPQVRSQSWSDDGRHVVLSDLRSWFGLYDADTWQPLGTTRRMSISPVLGWLIAPQARFVAMSNGIDGVSILDPRTLRPRHVLPQPYGATRFISWAISPDARWLALGRMNGETLLVDTGNGRERSLLPAGSRPTWISFSDDGRRLAVALEDGDFVVFDMPGGETVYRVRTAAALWGHQLQCNDTREPALEECLALLMEFDKITLWSMTGGGVFGAEPVLRGPEIAHHSFVPRFASAISREHGLLASGGQDGSLRLWRLPHTPLLARLAPTQRETPLRFDGQHVVGVDNDTAQVFDVRSGNARSPPMRVPTAVGFAALAGDGRSLVVSSGPELHVFDWRSGRRRYPPIRLGGSPMDLLLAADGGTVVSRWIGPDSKDDHSLLQAHALADGRALGPTADSRYMEGSIIDGDRLLVSEPDASVVYALSDLRVPRLRFPAPPDIRVPFTAHAPAGDELVQYLETEDALHNSLQWWSLRDGRRLQTLPLTARVDNLQVRARDSRIAISGNPGFTASGDVALLLDAYGRQTAITTTRRDSLTRAQAFSADGRLLAQALHNGVIVIDAGNGTPMGPTLKQSLPEPDRIAQLAFGPDGRQLVARTALGRWLYWPLEGDPRPSALIDAEAALLSPKQGSVFAAPDAGLRDSLRQRGEDWATPVEPKPSTWSCLPPAGVIPPRPPHLPVALLDLSALYTQPLHEVMDYRATPSTAIMFWGHLCQVPLGRQRLRGIDYDLRGLLHLMHPDTRRPPNAPSLPSGTGRLAVAPGRYAGAYVLNLMDTMPLRQDKAVAEVRFHYRDGSQARTPMQTWYEDYAGSHGPVRPGVRRAWAGSAPEAESYFSYFSLFESQVRNPHPERELVAIDLETTAPLVGPGGLGVVAITLEPAAATTASTQSK